MESYIPPCPSATAPRTAFISGPLDSPLGYFTLHYAPSIQCAVTQGDSFVIGPAPGIDTFALSYLLSAAVPRSRIIVFLTEFEAATYRQRFEAFLESGGNIRVVGRTTSERDAAMTEASDYDILRYLSTEEAKRVYGMAWYPKVTATEMNEIRRRRRGNMGSTEGEVSEMKNGNGKVERKGRSRKTMKDELKAPGVWDWWNVTGWFRALSGSGF